MLSLYSNQLTELSLTEDLKEEEWIVLRHCLKQNSSLTSLALPLVSGRRRCGAWAACEQLQLAELIVALPLQSLSLFRAPLRGTVFLKQLLPHLPVSVVHLQLSGVGPEGGLALGLVCGNCSMLTSLALGTPYGMPQMGPRAAVSLATALQRHKCSITALDLEGNLIRDEGGRAVLESLHGSTALKKLNLARNLITRGELLQQLQGLVEGSGADLTLTPQQLRLPVTLFQWVGAGNGAAAHSRRQHVSRADPVQRTPAALDVEIREKTLHASEKFAAVINKLLRQRSAFSSQEAKQACDFLWARHQEEQDRLRALAAGGDDHTYTPALVPVAAVARYEPTWEQDFKCDELSAFPELAELLSQGQTLFSRDEVNELKIDLPGQSLPDKLPVSIFRWKKLAVWDEDDRCPTFRTLLRKKRQGVDLVRKRYDYWLGQHASAGEVVKMKEDLTAEQLMFKAETEEMRSVSDKEVEEVVEPKEELTNDAAMPSSAKHEDCEKGLSQAICLPLMISDPISKALRAGKRCFTAEELEAAMEDTVYFPGQLGGLSILVEYAKGGKRFASFFVLEQQYFTRVDIGSVRIGVQYGVETRFRMPHSNPRPPTVWRPNVQSDAQQDWPAFSLFTANGDLVTPSGVDHNTRPFDLFASPFFQIEDDLAAQADFLEAELTKLATPLLDRLYTQFRLGESEAGPQDMDKLTREAQQHLKPIIDRGGGHRERLVEDNLHQDFEHYAAYMRLGLRRDRQLDWRWGSAQLKLKTQPQPKKQLELKHTARRELRKQKGLRSAMRVGVKRKLRTNRLERLRQGGMQQGEASDDEEAEVEVASQNGPSSTHWRVEQGEASDDEEAEVKVASHNGPFSTHWRVLQKLKELSVIGAMSHQSCESMLMNCSELALRKWNFDVDLGKAVKLDPQRLREEIHHTDMVAMGKKGWQTGMGENEDSWDRWHYPQDSCGLRLDEAQVETLSSWESQLRANMSPQDWLNVEDTQGSDAGGADKPMAVAAAKKPKKEKKAKKGKQEEMEKKKWDGEGRREQAGDGLMPRDVQTSRFRKLMASFQSRWCAANKWRGARSEQEWAVRFPLFVSSAAVGIDAPFFAERLDVFTYEDAARSIRQHAIWEALIQEARAEDGALCCIWPLERAWPGAPLADIYSQWKGQSSRALADTAKRVQIPTDDGLQRVEEAMTDLSALSTRVEQVVAYLSTKKKLELVQERAVAQHSPLSRLKDAVNKLSAITLHLEAAASAHLQPKR